MPESILKEAEELINGDRAAAYGSPLEQYNHLAELLNAYLGISTITWQDAINIMLLIKINRVRPGKPFHRDSYADTAGYAGCAEKAHNESQAAAAQPGAWGSRQKDLLTGTALVTDPCLPRKWAELLNVPKGVVVLDRGSYYWSRGEGGSWSWTGRGGRLNSQLFKMGPFTEVIGG